MRLVKYQSWRTLLGGIYEIVGMNVFVHAYDFVYGISIIEYNLIPPSYDLTPIVRY